MPRSLLSPSFPEMWQFMMTLTKWRKIKSKAIRVRINRLEKKTKMQLKRKDSNLYARLIFLRQNGCRQKKRIAVLDHPLQMVQPPKLLAKEPHTWWLYLNLPQDNSDICSLKRLISRKRVIKAETFRKNGKFQANSWRIDKIVNYFFEIRFWASQYVIWA